MTEGINDSRRGEREGGSGEGKTGPLQTPTNVREKVIDLEREVRRGSGEDNDSEGTEERGEEMTTGGTG